MHRSSEAPRHRAALSDGRLRNSETGWPPKVKYRNSYMSPILAEAVLMQTVAYVYSRTSACQARGLRIRPVPECTVYLPATLAAMRVRAICSGNRASTFVGIGL